MEAPGQLLVGPCLILERLALFHHDLHDVGGGRRGGQNGADGETKGANDARHAPHAISGVRS
jgi:hypothetical protein